MIREREKVAFVDDACPDCGGKAFNPGPRGGLAHNIRCASCGSTFWFGPPFTPERIAPVEGVYQLDQRMSLAQIALIPPMPQRPYWFTPGLAECRPDLTVCPLCGNDPAKCPQGDMYGRV